MFDCHMHMVLDGVDWQAAILRHKTAVDKAYVEKTIRHYHRLGYTYLRDGGDKWGVGKYAREVAKKFGIVYRTPLAPLSKVGHYGGFIGLQWENMKDFHRLVKLQKAQGGDFLKIMVSGLMDFDHYGVLTQAPLTKEEIRELIHIGKEEGFSVMVHCNGAQAITACAEAGADSIEHGAYPDEESLAAMQERGVVWCPTLSTIGALLGKGRFDEANVRAIFHKHLENLSRFRGYVALGTDAGAWAVEHGYPREREFLEMANADFVPGSEKIMEKF